MPISYLSQTIKSNPFIQPFDLDLMMKVNMYKQGEFYRNAQKAETLITQLNNADIANPEQRAYLKAKVNNLTTQLNSVGAINYSDANIANAIEGFAAEIYQDETVMSGIASTKMIRDWQSNVQKLKTDPKLNKYYNGANEAWDYEKYVKPYINGGIHATYAGPRAPKPYTGNPFTKVMSLIKEMRPDIETRIDKETGNTFFFSKTEKKYLSPEKISAAIDGFIDGDTKQQLQIDAWYNYDYSTGNTFSKQQGMDIYTQDLDNQIRDKNESLKRIDEQLAVEPDVNKRASLEEYKKVVQQNLNDYTTKRGEFINKFGKEWDENPTIAKYKLYMNRFQKDLLKAAGYTETKNTLLKNEERLFQARQQLEYTKNGLHWVTDPQGNPLYNSDGTPRVVAVSGAENMGKKGDKDGDGKDKKTAQQIADGVFHDLEYNTEITAEAEAKNRVNETTLLNDNKIIEQEMTKNLKGFLETVMKRGGYTVGQDGKAPLFEFKTVPEKNKAAAATISINPLLEQIQKIGADDVLSREDIQFLLDEVEKIDTSGKKPPAAYNLTTDGQTVGVTKEQIGFFRKMLANWDAVAVGQLKAEDAPMNVSPTEMSNFVENYQMLNMVKQSNVSYINKVKEQAMQGLGLSSEQTQRYKYFLDNPDAQGKLEFSGSDEFGRPIETYVENKEWTNLKKQAKVSYGEVEKRIKDSFKNASNRLNYYSLYLPNAEALEKAAPGVMNKVRKHSANNNGTTEQITPNSIIRDGDNFKLVYTYGKGDKAKVGEVQLDATEALKLGGELFPDKPLEKLLNYETTTGPIYTYSPAFNVPIKYSIDRESNDRNNRIFIPYIYYGNTRIPVYAGDKTSFQGSANDAKLLLKHYITTIPAKNIEEFIKGLNVLAYQK